MRGARGWVLCSGLLLVAGCVWAPLQPEGEPVRVLSATDESCDELGNATARTRAHLGPFWRNPDKVKRELRTLARNEAGRMGGNAIRALGPPANGEQRFAVLRCP